VAERLGHSLKRTRGWEPVTRYWKSGGEWRSQPEVEWDEQEQGWMLALAIYRDTKCPHCSGFLEETTAPENADRYRHEPALECFRCRAFAQSHDAYEDQDSRPLLHRVPLRPRKR